MHILFIIDLVMANTHPNSLSKKRLVFGLSRKKNGKSKEVKTPGGKKLKVWLIDVGVVTCSPPNTDVEVPLFKQVKYLIFAINE
jgi:hypothetical protein